MAEIALTRDPLERVPLELVNGRWYLRDDLLRYSNGVSGKVRTALKLVEWAKAAGADALVYGGSVLSPAIGRVASVAALSGLDAYIVIGSDPAKALRHPTVRVVVEAGAQLVQVGVGYNPVLQKKSRDIAEGSDGMIYQVPYGVSTAPDATPEEVREFLEADAWQVDSLSGTGIETVVIAFGSGNAAAGMLYGLMTRPSPVRHVKLVGVGPDRWEWLDRRFQALGKSLRTADFKIELLPLHPHFAEYHDRMPETCDGIDFHPLYEGKVVRFLDRLGPEWWTRRDETTCFWIVGGPLP